MGLSMKTSHIEAELAAETDSAWVQRLPGWFVAACSPAQTADERERWLARWRALDHAGKAQAETPNRLLRGRTRARERRRPLGGGHDREVGPRQLSHATFRTVADHLADDRHASVDGGRRVVHVRRNLSDITCGRRFRICCGTVNT
jgi:hypothetical protein